MAILKLFSHYTDLQPNNNKTALVIGSVEDNEANLWSQALGILVVLLPATYLVLLLCSGRISARDCLLDLEKMMCKI